MPTIRQKTAKKDRIPSKILIEGQSFPQVLKIVFLEIQRRKKKGGEK